MFFSPQTAIAGQDMAKNVTDWGPLLRRRMFVPPQCGQAGSLLSCLPPITRSGYSIPVDGPVPLQRHTL